MLYDDVAYRQSRLLTLAYSSSFGSASRLFDRSIRPHIYAIYGLTRIADEIVDTYKGPDAAELLVQLERDVTQALASGYSTNPIVHAFSLTARHFKINDSLIRPFFFSMQLDLSPQHYDDKLYQTYIHGSAEVVGLMCLHVFCGGNSTMIKALTPSATALGAAYQKINFLRDIKADHEELGRLYFPGVTFESFSDDDRDSIVFDIERDLDKVNEKIDRLPRTARTAVMISLAYYTTLLKKLAITSASTLKRERVRINGFTKAGLMGRVVAKQAVRR